MHEKREADKARGGKVFAEVLDAKSRIDRENELCEEASDTLKQAQQAMATYEKKLALFFIKKQKNKKN